MNDNYLDEKEQSAVMSFTQNKVMFDAVQKVLLACIYHQGTVAPGDNPTPYNFAFNIVQGVKSNEQIGEELRASVTALNYIKAGFERLKEVHREEPRKQKKNPAI